DFIAVVQQRNTAEGKNQVVQQQDHPNGGVDGLGVASVQRVLQSCQRGQRPGDAGITGLLVTCEGQSACRGSGILPREKIDQEAAVFAGVVTGQHDVTIVDA